MSELENRVNTQREILNIVNSKTWPCEPLFSLSHVAIERWANYNQISSKSDLVINLLQASEQLFFLANKSQEQITEGYRTLSKNLSDSIQVIKKIISADKT